MKFFHTADWHLGKLVQGVYMTEDQEYVLQQFIQSVREERPDAVIISGDLYDRAVPPPEAIQLLDSVLRAIVLELDTPVLAIGGNHDSPSRLHFGSSMMRKNGFYIAGQLTDDYEPVILHDEAGEVHFHLIPYNDPSTVQNIFAAEDVGTHNEAAAKIIEHLQLHMDPNARHVFVGHSFVTPHGEERENTSDSERPLSIGGVEYVSAELLQDFDYAALGHLHQAHYVKYKHIRYAGSPLKYSISEENHKKGFYIVEIDGSGDVTVEKRLFHARRDLRTVRASMEEIYTHEVNDDYVFVQLTDDAPVLSPMEKIRSIYPNAMHVERVHDGIPMSLTATEEKVERTKMSDFELFQSFYKEVKGEQPSEETEAIFKEVLDTFLREERETS